MRHLLLALAALAVAALAALGLLALMGRGGLLAGPLVARVSLSPFAVPADYGLDPVAITDDLVARMQDRVGRDIALQMMLEDGGEAVLRDQAIPRLLNAGVVRRLLEEMPGLGTVLTVGEAQALATVEVENRGDATLEDVALALPAPLRVEGAEPRDQGEGLASLGLGALEPGATARVTAWFAQPPGDLAPSPAWRVGAKGLDGRVLLYARQTGWRGADLQVMPWARWLAAGLLAALAAGALALAALALLPARRIRSA